MKNLSAVGIDTAKNSCYVVGFSATGEVVGRRRFGRVGLKRWLAKQKPLTVYLEACAGSHAWGRYCRGLGHEVKLIAPQFVKPYRLGEKNDWNDALAIGVAGRQPTMRFVGIKSEAQQALQSLHRVRQRAQRERVAIANQMRGLLGEYGLVVGRSMRVLRERLMEILADEENGLPGMLREVLWDLYEDWQRVDARVAKYTKQLETLAAGDVQARALLALPGIGPVTATALVAEIADARVFRNGRQLAAYLGLVPRQHSTGGRERLLGISKRGNGYVRQLLIHGARTVIQHLGDKTDRTSCWTRALIARRGINKATVALANKQARWAWVVMTRALEA